jgi:hypothetical protein
MGKRESKEQAKLPSCPNLGTGGLAGVRSQLSSRPSGPAAASSRWQASVSPSISGHGSGADRSSLVFHGIVDDSYSYHPLMGSLSFFVKDSFSRLSLTFRES